MNHKLLLSEKDRWNYFWSFFKFNLNGDIWKPEDRPKLESYFNYSRSPDGTMTNEEIESFHFWQKCLDEYARENAEIRDSIENIDTNSLICAFGYQDATELEQNDDNWDYNINNPLESLIELTYPVICINWLESGMDGRGNKGSVCCVDYVEYKEFDHAKTIAMLSK